jgi:hypothetical protein
MKISKEYFSRIAQSTDLEDWFEKRFKEGEAEYQELIYAIAEEYDSNIALTIMDEVSLADMSPEIKIAGGHYDDDILIAGHLIILGDITVKGGIFAVGDIISSGKIDTKGDIESGGKIKAKDLKSGLGIYAKSYIDVVSSISARSQIISGMFINAGDLISSGGRILSRCSIFAEGIYSCDSIISEGTIISRTNIQAGSKICSGSKIKAGQDIEAVKSIISGREIEAGNNVALFGEGVGILAGLDCELSRIREFGRVVSRVKPENIICGHWVSPDDDEKQTQDSL